MIDHRELAAPASASAPAATTLAARAAACASKLTDAGCVETAELVGRLADRLIRQERLLVEERARAADLELRLARALSAPAQIGALAAG